MFHLEVMHMRKDTASRITALGQFTEKEAAFEAGHQFVVHENVRRKGEC